MALFSGKAGQKTVPGDSGAAPATPTGAPDTAQASALPEVGLGVGGVKGAGEGASAHENSGGIEGALQNLLKFFSAKPASASNDLKYQKALEEAGIPADQTGVGGQGK